MAAACLLSIALAAGSENVFDLKEIHPLSVTSGGLRMFLSLTGQPSYLLTLTNMNPATLKGRDQSVPGRVQVRYGRDLVGTAHIDVVAPQTNSSLISITLTFKTEDQARAAAKVLRLRDATPTPLPKAAANR